MGSVQTISHSEYFTISCSCSMCVHIRARRGRDYQRPSCGALHLAQRVCQAARRNNHLRETRDTEQVCRLSIVSVNHASAITTGKDRK